MNDISFRNKKNKSEAKRRKGTRVMARDGTDATDQIRREVLRAAAAVFIEYGYAATSIDKIAEMFGATKGRVYYYYRSKADLFFELHRVAMEMNLDTIRPIAMEDVPARERLEKMITAHAHLVMRELPLQCVSVQGVHMHLTGNTTPEQRRLLIRLIEDRDEFERYYLDVLSQGVGSGEFRPCDPRILIKPLLGALNWMTVWYRPRPNETEESREHIAREHAEFLLRGVLRDHMAAQGDRA